MANEFRLPDGTRWTADLNEFKRPPEGSKFFEGHHVCHPADGGEPKLFPASIVGALIKRYASGAEEKLPTT